MIATHDILLVPVAQLASSKLNPRQHFDESEIERLSASLAKDGLLENLIVRPGWCVGLETQSQLAEQKFAHPDMGAGDAFEIVSGERRFRGARKAGLETLACRVCLLTDPETVEINLTEQMHRHQLTPMEEAQSFAKLLGYHNDDGTPRHTAESLALRLSVTDRVIYDRLQLLKLPKTAATALEEGQLGMTIASMIARIPDAAMAAEATKAVISGGVDGEPMTKLQAKAYIAEHCMRELKGAPFDQDDAELVKHLPQFSPHTSCTDCPFRTGNNREKFGDVKRGDVCTRPACYQAKCAAAFAKASAAAEAAGRKVLTEAESEKEFPAFQPAGQLAFNSPYAKLDDTPAAHLLKAVVKNPPDYRELVATLTEAGMSPTVYLAKDQTGHAVELVKVAQIVAGAEKAGEPVFREKNPPKAGPAPDDVHMREENKRLKAEAALREAIVHASVQAVHNALSTMALDGVWELLLALQIEHNPGNYASWRLIAKALGVAKPDDKAIKQLVNSLSRPAQLALLPLALLGNGIAEQGIDNHAFAALATLAGVKLKAIDKDLRSTAKKPSAAKAPPRKAKAVRKKAPERSLKRPRGDAGDRAVALVKASLKTTKKGGSHG